MDRPVLKPHSPVRVAVIGGGFSGLAAAYELGRRGLEAVVLEADDEVGGLAASFTLGGARLEKFYHHWFTNDQQIMDLIAELGRRDRVLRRPSLTGMYYGGGFHKLSTPWDLLRFSAVPLIDRLRLGLLTLRVRRVKDWRDLEDQTAAQWLRDMVGQRCYRVVWEPLLRGKFGELAEEVSAVWFWNKLKLRGGSRGKGGKEHLSYYQGGFGALVDDLAQAITAQGGEIRTRAPVSRLLAQDGRVRGVAVNGDEIPADYVLATPALPIVADLVEPFVDPEYTAQLRRVRYLANLCVVLELDRGLSDIYWLNVNDPGFPFVAIIEHTNFEPPGSYAGRHVVYLSKYLLADDPLYSLPDDQVVASSLEHLRRMHPDLKPEWVLGSHVWRARYAQPLTERYYRRLIPAEKTPLEGLYLASMAQVHPEDRGTNYAVREGRAVARMIADQAGA